MKAPRITIRIRKGRQWAGCFDVIMDGKVADKLQFDEMIGQVIALTHPKLGKPHYGMRTAKEMIERERKNRKKGNENER